MNNRNTTRKPELKSLLEEEETYNRLISQEWSKKISIYADILFSMDSEDFIDFMTGSMALIFGTMATIVAAKHTAAEMTHFCLDPSIQAFELMTMAGSALFCGALHLLYKYSDYRNDLNNVNTQIKYYTEKKLLTENRRHTLFPEPNKSYLSSAMESVRNAFGI